MKLTALIIAASLIAIPCFGQEKKPESKMAPRVYLVEQLKEMLK